MLAMLPSIPRMNGKGNGRYPFPNPHNPAVEGARAMSVHSRHPYFLSNTEKAQIRLLYAIGRSSREIAQIVGRSSGSVNHVLKQLGVKKRTVKEVTRRYSLREDAFNCAEKDPEAAYWVGMLMADGWISDGGIVSLGLQESDIEHVYKFRRFLGTDYPIRTKEQKGFSKSGSRISSLTVCSRKLATSLERYGVVPRKSKTAKAVILENNSHFWRGVIDGDGTIDFVTINKIPRISLCGSYDLLEQFADYIHKVTDGSRPKTHPHKTIWVVSVTGRTAVKIISILYSDDGTALRRKKILAEQAVRWTSLKSDWGFLTLECIYELYEKYGVCYGAWDRVSKHLGMSDSSLRQIRRKLQHQTTR